MLCRVTIGSYSVVFFNIYTGKFLGRNVVAYENVVEIHHNVAHFLNEMPPCLAVLKYGAVAVFLDDVTCLAQLAVQP